MPRGGPPDAELAFEDEGRHGAYPQAPYLVFQGTHFLAPRLSGPSRHVMARGDVGKDCRDADVPRLLEVGAKERVDHAVRLALPLREVDELMRSTRVGRALHALEGEFDADRASLGGDARVELLGALG